MLAITEYVHLLSIEGIIDEIKKHMSNKRKVEKSSEHSEKRARQFKTYEKKRLK